MRGLLYVPVPWQDLERCSGECRVVVPPIDPHLDDTVGFEVLHVPCHARARERECFCKLCPCHPRSVPQESDDLTGGIGAEVVQEALYTRGIHAPVLEIPDHPGAGERRDLPCPDEGKEVVPEGVPVDLHKPLQVDNIDPGVLYYGRVHAVPAFVFEHILPPDPAIPQKQEKGGGNPRP